MPMPDGEFCYIYHIYKADDNEICPDYDGTKSLEPRCEKFHKRLGWSVSGRVLKCEECLKANE